jgi:hypothetical protein
MPPENPRLPTNGGLPAKWEDAENVEFDRNPELAAAEPLNEL